MSKFLPQKRRLLEEVFKKASDNTTETSFSGILKNLEIILRDEYQIALSYKTFENYYKAIVKEEGEYPTKPSVLDDLSKYLGFDNFNDYCSGWRSFEHMITQSLSKLVITVINKPIIKMPEFLTKQSNIGILGVLLISGFFAGNKIFAEQKNGEYKQEQINTIPIGIAGPYEKKYMYWRKDQYMATDSSYLGPQVEVIPMEHNTFIYQKKIMRPDTLTIANAADKVWYDKSNNHVEFFTINGIHPENGKALKIATGHIIETYGGENALAELADN